jgi:hypothetical protein
VTVPSEEVQSSEYKFSSRPTGLGWHYGVNTAGVLSPRTAIIIIIIIALIRTAELQNRTLKPKKKKKHIDWKYKTPWNCPLYYMDADVGQLENTINPG